MGWERLPAVPLSPRTDPVVAWTGTEVVVVGGNTGWVCPPNADCAGPTDLAAGRRRPRPGDRDLADDRPRARRPLGQLGVAAGTPSSSVDLLVVRGDARDRTWRGYDVSATTGGAP